MANTKHADRFYPTENQIDAFNDMFLQGMVTHQGKIIGSVNNGFIVYGKARDISPAYQNWVSDLNNVATKYPINDPRTWIPLVKQGMKTGDLGLHDVMVTDNERMSINGDWNGPYAVPRTPVPTPPATNAANAAPETPLTTDPPQPTTPDDGGVVGNVWDFAKEATAKLLGGVDVTGQVPVTGQATGIHLAGAAEPVAGMVAADQAAAAGVADVYSTANDLVNQVEDPVRQQIAQHTPEPIRHAEANVGHALGNVAHAGSNVGNVVSKLVDNALIKGVSRNTFALMNAAYQGGVVGTAANVDAALSKGDWKAAVGYAYIPFNPDNYAQSEGGQILGALVQGENIDEGTGFFVNPESDIGQQALDARLAANTLVPEEPITKEQMGQYAKIARMSGTEAALNYAQSQGWQWNEEDNKFVLPAQGFTFGRALAIQITQPHTEAYNTMSGIIDFGSAIGLDPVNYIPGGAFTKAATTLSAGRKVLEEANAAVGVFDKSGDFIYTPAEYAALKEGTGDVGLYTKTGDLFATPDEYKALKTGESGPSALDWKAQLKDGHLVEADPAVIEITNIAKGLKRGEFHLSSPAAYDALRGPTLALGVRGIAQETKSYKIWMKTHGKLAPQVYGPLAKAETPEEVEAILAPRMGIDIQRPGDLAGMAVGIPETTIRTSVANATDVEAIKAALVKHLPGMNFMPGLEMDIDSLPNSVDQLRRLGGVAFKKIDDDEKWVDAMSQVINTFDATGVAGRAAKFQAVYGYKGDTVLLNANGEVMMDAADYARAEAKGLLPPPEVMAASGLEVQSTGKDGVLAVLMNKMVDEAGLERSLAKKLVKAWRDDMDGPRHYGHDGMGGDWLPTWSDQARGEPFSEADAMGKMVSLPNAAEIRKHLGRLSHIIDTMKAAGGGLEKTAEAERFLADQTTALVYHWKQLVLMGFGVRYPAFAMRNTLDTMFTAALSGGSGLLRTPRDYLGLAVANAMRDAVAADSGAKGARAAIANSINPYARMLFRYDDMRLDAAGNLFSDGFRKALAGDPSGLDDAARGLNASAGARGSFAQDVRYDHIANEYDDISVNDLDRWDDYAGELIDEYHRHAVGSPTFRRIVDPEKTMNDNINWFITPRDDGGIEVIKHFGAGGKADAALSTPQGVQDYLENITNYIHKITGGHPELMEAIRTDEWNGEPIMLVKKGSHVPNPKFIKRIRELVDDEHITLPSTLAVKRGRNAPFQRHTWDSVMGGLFHSAGQWDDMFGRVPFFQEKYFAHVKTMLHLMDPEERAKMAADFRRTGNINMAKAAQKVSVRGAVTRQEIHRVAQLRAANELNSIAYNAANRREWAYALRIVAPFAQAAVNGMYRWARAAAQNPDNTYRLLRAANFLTSDDSAKVSEWMQTGSQGGQPLVFEDPRDGSRQISIPLAGMAAQLMGLPEQAGTMFSISASSLNQAFPNYEQAMADAKQPGGANGWQTAVKVLWPGVGPVITIPAAWLNDDLDGFLKDLVLPYGVGQGSGFGSLVNQVTPRVLQDLANILRGGPDQDARMGGNTTFFAGQLMADEKTDIYDPVAVASVWDRARSMARTMAVVDAFGGIFTPSQLTLDAVYKDAGDIPNNMVFAKVLGGVLHDYVENEPNHDYVKAQGEMIADWGLGSLLYATPSGPNSDAAPPTYNSAALLKADPAAYKKFEPVLQYLLTNPSGNELDLDFYAKQVAEGERAPMTLPMREKATTQVLLDYVYNYQLQQIMAEPVEEWQKNAARVDLEAQMVAAGRPDSIDITTAARNYNAKLLLDATRDPTMVDFMGGPDTAALLSHYLQSRQAEITALQQAGTLGNIGEMTSTAADNRFRLFTQGEAYASHNEAFSYIWWKTLRSEVLPVEEGTTP